MPRNPSVWLWLLWSLRLGLWETPPSYPPAKLKLPPHIADTPSTRKHFSDYLAEITYMDGQVGQILEVLEAEWEGQ